MSEREGVGARFLSLRSFPFLHYFVNDARQSLVPIAAAEEPTGIGEAPRIGEDG